MKSVLIVGCGNMGALYDLQSAADEPPRSHLTGFMRHGGFNILGVVDPNDGQLGKVKEIYPHIRTFSSLKEFGPLGSVDVLSLAASTAVRTAVLDEALGVVQVIFCEKPLAQSYEEAARIRHKVLSSKTKFVVNYTRRWDANLNSCLARIRSGEWGDLQSIQAVYTKGFINNASHTYDLLAGLGIQPIAVRRCGPFVEDGFFEPTFSFEIKYLAPQSPKKEKLPVTTVSQSSNACEIVARFDALNTKFYSAWEINLWLEEARVRISESGAEIEILKRKADEKYQGYYFLRDGEFYKNGMIHCLQDAVRDVYLLTESDVKIKCGIEEAWQDMRLAETLRRSCEMPDQWIGLVD